MLHNAEIYIIEESNVKVVPYPCFVEATSKHEDAFDFIQIVLTGMYTCHQFTDTRSVR